MPPKDTTAQLPPNETNLESSMLRLIAEGFEAESGYFDGHGRFTLRFADDELFAEANADELASKFFLPLRRSRRLEAQALVDGIRDEAESARQRVACEAAQGKWGDVFHESLRAGAPNRKRLQQRWHSAVANLDAAGIAELGAEARATLDRIEDDQIRVEANIAKLEALNAA